MIAPKAREDFDDLLAEGLHPTLEDFDRLNCLALRMERGDETFGANAPRIGWAGDVPFHQPTVQAFEWYLRYARRVGDLPDGEVLKVWAWYYALNRAEERGAFDGLRTAEEIADAVRTWRETLNVTPDEVVRAVGFATYGFDDAAAGRNPNLPSDGAEADADDGADEALEALRVKVGNCAAEMGVPFRELAVETPSRLDAVYREHALRNGAKFKSRDGELYTAYKFALYEIRKRLESERDAAK